MSRSEKKIKLSELDLKEIVVEVRRVTKVVKGGRTIGFRAVVVIGNKDGIVGYGIGKSKTPMGAVQAAINQARKKLIKVPMVKTTIPHSVTTHYNATSVMLRPASPGTGVIAGSGVRAMLECAGVSNIFTKLRGSNNPQNAVKATFKALKNLRTPKTVAEQRHISVEKVFNG